MRTLGLRFGFKAAGVAAVGFVAVLFVVSGLMSIRRHGLPRGAVSIGAIQRVLFAYSNDHGSLPFHAEGADKALYLLRPYVRGARSPSYGAGPLSDARLFDCPDPDARINGPARWDDGMKKVVNADYDYLNLKDANPLGGTSPARAEDLIILAEKSGLRRLGKWFLMYDGHRAWYTYPRPGQPVEVVGRTRRDLAGRAP